MEKSNIPAGIDKDIYEILNNILTLAGIRARIDVREFRPDEGREGIYVNIKTKSSDGLLIGRKGGTLRDIQYIIKAILAKKYEKLPLIFLDVGGYRLRRENYVKKKAIAIAKIVKETGKEMAMDPLTEREVRLVMRTLEGLEGITAYTIGKGRNKNVVIAPE